MDILSMLNITTESLGVNLWLLRSFLFIVLVLIGCAIGNISILLLRKLAKKLELEKRIRPSFIELFNAVIRWAICIIFIVLALMQLQIPELTDFIARVLLTIPAFIGGLVLLVIGFSVALYLREVVEDSEVMGWRMLSQILFFFVIFIFGIYSIKIALFTFDETIKNFLILILTAVISVSIAYSIVKKESRNNLQKHGSS